MHSRAIQLLGVSLACSLVLAARAHAQGLTNDVKALEFGIPQSTLIISGNFLWTFSGGGGATSSVQIDKVFKAPEGFQAPAEITVYWTTRKQHDHISVQKGTNTFLFFLREEGKRGPTEYLDVTREVYPFINASPENVRVLVAKLKEKR